jgi:hypothetical protein
MVISLREYIYMIIINAIYKFTIDKFGFFPTKNYYNIKNNDFYLFREYSSLLAQQDKLHLISNSLNDFLSKYNFSFDREKNNAIKYSHF